MVNIKIKEAQLCVLIFFSLSSLLKIAEKTIKTTCVRDRAIIFEHCVWNLVLHMGSRFFLGSYQLNRTFLSFFLIANSFTRVISWDINAQEKVTIEKNSIVLSARHRLKSSDKLTRLFSLIFVALSDLNLFLHLSPQTLGATHEVL